MKLIGNILRIKSQRENQNQDIEIHVDKVTYITQKKDGRYYQPFEWIDTLDTPLMITGNLLARVDNKHAPEGEHEFKVYDQVGDTYTLNPNKSLLLTIEYDFDVRETILTEVDYTVTVSNEEFKQLKSNRPAAPEALPGKNRKRK